ncbi:PREDICTED: putative RNA-binding protein 15, partial [Mesitornis unicolor]|uniref:putative RNA-binding protein 15 n=1 Tax=Mesitornis unicolor TaxID=54374 RepID=UPI00052910A4
RFGVITEVDIKRPGRGQTSTYGFLKFENLDMAHRAKLAMSGKVLLRNPIKIGYGKATPTTRLWVGGLGPWVPLAALAREFDRFGTIRTIDYRKGDSWAYIQYESLDAAQAACTHMRGPLPLPPPAHYELVAEAAAFGAHRGAPPDPLRGARDRTPPLLYRDRDRDLYPETEWVPPPPPVRDRSNRAAAYDPLESLERRRDGWSLERDRGERELGSSSRDQPRKRRLAEDGGRHLDRSPDSERSSKKKGGRERYSSDPERSSSRLLLLERPSPVRESRRGSLERGQNEKRDRKNSAERERKHRLSAAAAAYRKQKQAAGVISLPVGGNKDKENSGVLHAFPPCDFSQQFLDSTAKALAKSEDDYLVMIIVRGAS